MVFVFYAVIRSFIFQNNAYCVKISVDEQTELRYTREKYIEKAENRRVRVPSHRQRAPGAEKGYGEVRRTWPGSCVGDR